MLGRAGFAVLPPNTGIEKPADVPLAFSAVRTTVPHRSSTITLRADVEQTSTSLPALVVFPAPLRARNAKSA